MGLAGSMGTFSSDAVVWSNGYQLCVHAIGDRGNRETLDIFERAFKANPASKDLRWRVEHAQHLNPADIARFSRRRRVPGRRISTMRPGFGQCASTSRPFTRARTT